jgi:ATP-dependent DNA ligase
VAETEIKHDGFRSMAKCGNGVVLLTKNDYDFTARFPLAAAWGSKPFDKARPA